MSSKPEKPYEIGYGKPPTETRFKKGKSGNPSGRPKRRAPQKDTGKILQHFDNEEIVLMVDGKPKRMLQGEVLFQQLFKKAIKGNLEAARLIARMAAKYFGPEAQGPSEVRFEVRPDDYFTQKDSAKPKENP
jgi:hypothetical protein